MRCAGEPQASAAWQGKAAAGASAGGRLHNGLVASAAHDGGGGTRGSGGACGGTILCRVLLALAPRAVLADEVLLLHLGDEPAAVDRDGLDAFFAGEHRGPGLEAARGAVWRVVGDEDAAHFLPLGLGDAHGLEGVGHHEVVLLLRLPDLLLVGGKPYHRGRAVPSGGACGGADAARVGLLAHAIRAPILVRRSSLSDMLRCLMRLAQISDPAAGPGIV